MNEFRGRCHCGNLAVRFQTAKAAAELPLRSCQCSFCTRHRTRNTVDPAGRAVVSVRDAAKLSRYQWAARGAEFLVCRECGGYLGAVISSNGRRCMTLNVNLFEEVEQFTQPSEAVDYESETPEARRRRRELGWIPAEVPWG